MTALKSRPVSAKRSASGFRDRDARLLGIGERPVIALIVSLVLANSPYKEAYQTLRFYRPIMAGIFSCMTLLDWVNQGLMALFFVSIGFELVQKYREDGLSQKGALWYPILGALGGIVGATLVYLGIIGLWGTREMSRGWPIPIATDMACLILVLQVFRSRLPRIVQDFLFSLAVLEGLGGALLLLFWQPPTLNVVGITLLAASIIAWKVLRTLHQICPVRYIAVGVWAWLGLKLLGIHPAWSGVMTGLALPDYNRISVSWPRNWLNKLNWIVDGLIVPLFVLFNAGISIVLPAEGQGSAMPVLWAVLFSLILGKPLGVLVGGWIASKLPMSRRFLKEMTPPIMACSFLCGIGFTLSFLFSEVIFGGNPQLLGAAQLGVLVGSLGSILLGCLGLYSTLPKNVRVRRIKMPPLPQF